MALSDILSFNHPISSVFDTFNNMRQALANHAQTVAATNATTQGSQEADPLYWIQKYKAILQNYPEDSPEYQYANAALGGIVNNASNSPQCRVGGNSK